MKDLRYNWMLYIACIMLWVVIAPYIYKQFPECTPHKQTQQLLEQLSWINQRLDDDYLCKEFLKYNK